MADVAQLPDPVDPELVEGLSGLLARLGEASRFNLLTALRAAEIDGVSGEMTIHIPAKTRDRVEIDWVSKPSS